MLWFSSNVKLSIVGKHHHLVPKPCCHLSHAVMIVFSCFLLTILVTDDKLETLADQLSSNTNPLIRFFISRLALHSSDNRAYHSSPVSLFCSTMSEADTVGSVYTRLRVETFETLLLLCARLTLLNGRLNIVLFCSCHTCSITLLQQTL